MLASYPIGRHAGQAHQPVESQGAQRAARPRSIPADQWPEDPRHAVPEVLRDEHGAELPRYRATEPCYSSVDVDGGRLVEADHEVYVTGRPAHYHEPVNQAAMDMMASHPPGDYMDPVEAIVI